MIIKKEEVAEEDPQLMLDAPPSYDQIIPSRSSATSDFRPDVKAGPSSSPSTPTPTSISGPPLQQAKQKPRTTWLDSFRLSQQAKEVRSTVRSIVRDVVKEPKTPASMGLLESCADACYSNNLSFSEILQDPSVEGHPAIYWAIVKRPSPDDFELITSLMAYSAPLTTETMTEVRLACLHVGDQALFQCLWRSPEYGALSGADRMLLGVTSPPDTVDVEELPGQDGPFAVRLNIVHFEKRMKVSGDISFEFIARGASHVKFSRRFSYFPFVRENMETEVLCDEERYDESTRSMGHHDDHDGTKPSHKTGCSHRHQRTGEGASEPTLCGTSQRHPRFIFNSLVLCLVTKTAPAD